MPVRTSTPFLISISAAYVPGVRVVSAVVSGIVPRPFGMSETDAVISLTAIEYAASERSIKLSLDAFLIAPDRQLRLFDPEA